MYGGSDFEDVMLTLPTGIGSPTEPARNPRRYDYLFKLIIIGDPSVGKTNLTMKFCDRDFNEHYMATIGIDFKVKSVEIGGSRIKLQIWDTAGQERFQSISKMYYRGAHGVMFVYDVTNRQSFESVRRWVAAYEEASGESSSVSDITRVLIANKCDDTDHRSVTTEAGVTAAMNYGLRYFETSAKTGYNVETVFCYMAKDILHRLEKERKDQELPKTVKAKIKKNRQRKGASGWSWSMCSLL